jgi:hypothetical protein
MARIVDGLLRFWREHVRGPQLQTYEAACEELGGVPWRPFRDSTDRWFLDGGLPSAEPPRSYEPTRPRPPAPRSPAYEATINYTPSSRRGAPLPATPPPPPRTAAAHRVHTPEPQRRSEPRAVEPPRRSEPRRAREEVKPPSFDSLSPVTLDARPPSFVTERVGPLLDTDALRIGPKSHKLAWLGVGAATLLMIALVAVSSIGSAAPSPVQVEPLARPAPVATPALPAARPATTPPPSTLSSRPASPQKTAPHPTKRARPKRPRRR